MIKNKYPDGRVDIVNGNSVIELHTDKSVFFCYYDDQHIEGEDDYGFRYDLLSFVGDSWRPEIDEIISTFDIKMGKFEDERNYYDIWISYNDNSLVV